MCIVYYRYFYDVDHEKELGAAFSQKVPTTKLAYFLLYAPHYFRFHENHSLAAYIHIFRYVYAMHIRDTKRGRPMAFTIKDDDIDCEKVMRLVKTMDFKADEWIEIVPPSFHGSQLTMPAHYGPRALRSEDITKSLMLPDVYTLGFPVYINSGARGEDVPGELYRPIIVHKNWTWNTTHVVASTSVHANTRLRDDLDPYDSEEIQLWTSPQARARAPWTDHLVIDTTPRQLERHPPVFNCDRQDPNDLPRPQLAAEPFIPLAAAEKYLKKLIAQVRAAREKGLILPELQFGSNGLTWDGMSEQVAHDKELHSQINIDRMVTEDAEIQADTLSPKDRLVLKRFMDEDLAEDKHFARCLLTFKDTIKPSDDNLKKSDIVTAMDAVYEPIRNARESILAYGNGEKSGHNAFADCIMQPCCLLLGLDYPGNLNEAHRAIHTLDFELGMAVANIALHLAQPTTAADLKSVVDKLSSVDKLTYAIRFDLLRTRLVGRKFTNKDEDGWKQAFGSAYSD
ncbi:hypothetical protein CkaCkLH20_07134 [Colletotrichum karsti]|uniref:Uncharacterized protein n=1 Tax=Colletotrichum karsti TaxID=1095194 RepID=A0A9P6I304_9PEZI|nr:uncharacterized protein CkaCkLH20_07134 [Colletotrichum karsti]KAF9875314.1 hypothetical protein CkaCkLH20_07134 [Colletotrichum karsti]